jgi:hypothetical protein
MTSPYWERTTSAEDYGGHPQKRDYGMTGCVNALTDASAAQIKRLTADMAALARTSPLWTGTIARSGSVFTVSFSRPAWGDYSLSYTGSVPPTGHPSVALTDTNQVTITFPSSASDEYGSTGLIRVSSVVPMQTGVSWVGTVNVPTVVLTSFADGLTVPVMVW